MKKAPFDNDLYLKIQRENILKRISKFGDKLYLEFGGKLFDDLHASRVLPGFQPDSKLQMLLGIKDKAEIVIVVNANDINSNKVRGDIGITYQQDVLRLIDTYKEVGLYVSSVIISFYQELANVLEFEKQLTNNGINVYKSYKINGYPQNIPLIVSDEGLGKNEWVKTTRPLVVVTAPGPGSGKMAACLSQIYLDNKNGIRAGYAKYETFPVWNLPLNHPVNLAYEAATIDLNDVNMIDPYHLEKYGVTAINYNRDVEVFPLLKAIFELRIASLLGFQPDVVMCRKCGNYLPETLYFSVEDGCFFCDTCCQQGILMPAGTLQAVRYIILRDFEKIFSFHISERCRQPLFAFAEEFLQYHVDKKFPALEYYKQIKI